MVARGRVRSFVEGAWWEILAAVILVVWLGYATATRKPPPPPPPPRVVEVELAATLLKPRDGAIRRAPIDLLEAPAEWPTWVGPGAPPAAATLEIIRDGRRRLEPKALQLAREDYPIRNEHRGRAGFSSDVMQLGGTGCAEHPQTVEWAFSPENQALQTACVMLETEPVEVAIAETLRVFVARVRPRTWPADLTARLDWARRALSRLFDLRGQGAAGLTDIELRYRVLGNDEALLLTRTHSTSRHEWYEEATGLIDARGVMLVFDRVRDGRYAGPF